MMKAVTVIFLAVFFSACGGAPGPMEENGTREPAENTAAEITQEDPGARFRREIGDSKGVIVLTDRYGEEDTVKIYDKGGPVWYEFSYYDESAFDDLESINTDFKPFAFHPDYLLLAMRVVGEDSALYEVVVNEEADLRKFVRKDDENLAFEPFEKHIISVYAVDFDAGTNPLRAEPGGEPLRGDFSMVPIFKPSRTEGDWLEVTFRDPAPGRESNSNGIGGAPANGWIRWREGSLLKIAFFYIS